MKFKVIFDNKFLTFFDIKAPDLSVLANQLKILIFICDYALVNNNKLWRPIWFFRIDNTYDSPCGFGYRAFFLNKTEAEFR